MTEKFALITGANTKLGIAICKEIASMGYSVVMADTNQNKQIYEQIRTRYAVEIIPLEIDLLERDSAQILFTYIDSYFETIELIINCGYFNSFNLRHTHSIITSSIYFSQKMKTQGYGTIINIAQEYSYRKKSHSIDSIIDNSRHLHHNYNRLGIEIKSISTGVLASRIYRLPNIALNFFTKIKAIYSIEKMAKITAKTISKPKRDHIPGWLNYTQVIITERLPNKLKRLYKKLT